MGPCTRSNGATPGAVTEKRDQKSGERARGLGLCRLDGVECAGNFCGSSHRAPHLQNAAPQEFLFSRTLAGSPIRPPCTRPSSPLSPPPPSPSNIASSPRTSRWPHIPPHTTRPPHAAHLGAPRPRTLDSRRAEPALRPAQRRSHFLVGGGRGLRAQPRRDRGRDPGGCGQIPGPAHPRRYGAARTSVKSSSAQDSLGERTLSLRTTFCVGKLRLGERGSRSSGHKECRSFETTGRHPGTQ